MYVVNADTVLLPFRFVTMLVRVVLCDPADTNWMERGGTRADRGASAHAPHDSCVVVFQTAPTDESFTRTVVIA